MVEFACDVIWPWTSVSQAFVVTDSISLLVIGLFKFSVFSCFQHGRAIQALQVCLVPEVPGFCNKHDSECLLLTVSMLESALARLIGQVSHVFLSKGYSCRLVSHTLAKQSRLLHPVPYRQATWYVPRLPQNLRLPGAVFGWLLRSLWTGPGLAGQI